ncbi:MAG TPA: heavy metal-binding domain-containing protein, partial [Candidatus Eisenbacteria bacterium]|nr:heavy metal-binding domain-containing protein [Candidatus Eisenbacteria bacterium]
HVPRRYVCPMLCEPGRVYQRPGDCPVCGMDLQLVTSERYSVEVRPERAPVRAGRRVTLVFRIRDPAGFEVKDLEVVHEKLLHLMVVSDDLSEFDHVHPVRQADGRFTLVHTFRNGGRYTLYHDFTPPQVGMQVVPVEVEVQGARRAPRPLVVDDKRIGRAEGIDVKLTHTGLAPALGCGFAFWFSRDGKPVADLEPFLGAMGHLVIISEDRRAYIHSHPTEANATPGPIVQFAMTFPRTGLYKAWGQFQRRGKVLTVPFVVRVTASGHLDEPPPAEDATRR